MRLQTLILSQKDIQVFCSSSSPEFFENESQSTIIVTTNLTFGEWSTVYGGAKMTAALLDRLTHHCEIVETGIDRGASKTALKAKAEEC